MIVYQKTPWSFLTLLLRCSGSAIPRALPAFVLTTLGCIALYFLDPHSEDAWRHPYPYQIFAFVVGFATTYRCNYSYLRYMEARAHLQQMTDRLLEAAVTIAEFDNPKPISNPETAAGDQAFEARIMHLVSLLHALGMQHLRRDWNLKNLVPHRPHSRPPPVDPSLITSKENLYEVAKLHGYESGSCCADELEAFHRRHFGGWKLFTCFESLVSSGDQHEAVSWLRPLTVLGGLLEEEFELLDAPHVFTSCNCGDGNGCVVGPEPFFFKGQRPPPFSFMSDRYNGLVGPVLLPQESLENSKRRLEDGYVPPPDARFHICYGWVVNLIIARLNSGGMQMPHPILSRCFALLSDALHGFSQARKLAETPFPFPIAQMILVLLLALALTMPLLVSAYITVLWLQIVVCCLGICTYWTLNEVARDLEDPFVYDKNDFPMSYMQHAFNEYLQATVCGSRPTLEGLRILRSGKSHPYFKDPSIVPFGTVGDGNSSFRNSFAASRQISIAMPSTLAPVGSTSGESASSPLLAPVRE